MAKYPKFSIKMRTRDEIGLRPAGSTVYLSVNGRSEWCKRTAEKHLYDVKIDKNMVEVYDMFELEDA